MYRLRTALMLAWSIALVAILVACTAPTGTQNATPAATSPSPAVDATAGSTPTSPPANAPGVAATAPATPTANVPVTATTTAALDVAALCPDATDGTALYVNADNGLCFLYPSSMELITDVQRPQDVVALYGTVLDPQAQESVRTMLSVAYNGLTDGLDSAGYADKYTELQMPGMTLQAQPATVGGQPAQVVDNLPGFFAQRGAFVVANGHKYLITLQPKPEDVPELAQEAQGAWDTVTQSIVFFPPQNERKMVRASDVCPQATAGTKLLVSELNGYCLLYPADFEEDPTFPERIIGGPELGPAEGFDTVRTSIAAGTYYLGTLTPQEVLRPAGEQIDPASVLTTTIAGQPAVVFDFTGGPWRQRTTQILAGDSVYTLVAQPWDSQMFPQAVLDAERLWNTVTGSMAFFDKWH